MNEMLTVLPCPDQYVATDHTVNTVTGVATCETCEAETSLTPVELMDLIG